MKDYLRIYGVGLLLLIGSFVLAFQFVKPSPPKTITIATGSASGAYYANALKYQKVLAKEGIELTILTTEGSIDNLQQLQSGKADIAFVQSGTGQDFLKTYPEAEASFVSLASLYYEPLWLFIPKNKTVTKLSDLIGKRVAVGSDGSGTRVLSELLLNNNDITKINSSLMPLGGDQAYKKLLAGEIDSLFTVASVTAPLINNLLFSEELVPFNFDRAQAYTRRYRFLSSVELPQGVVNFSQDIPSKSLDLLAAAATLVSRKDLHPALVALLMQAVDEVHKDGGLLEDVGQFPSDKYLDFDLHKSAKNYFEYGPPLLQRYLPFWMAVLVNQLKVFLIPIIALMIPLSRILPPLYRWRVRSNIYRWYRDLREIESKLLDERFKQSYSKTTVDELAENLDVLQQDVIRQSAPLSYTDELYHLQTHINLVKERIDTLQPK